MNSKRKVLKKEKMQSNGGTSGIPIALEPLPQDSSPDVFPFFKGLFQ